MTQARSTLEDLSSTPYYHCMSRCVRRAFLCGRDDRDGKDYDHRKDWVVERLQLLTETFAMRILSFSAMSNHLHVLIQVDDGQAKHWAERDD